MTASQTTIHTRRITIVEGKPKPGCIAEALLRYQGQVAS